MADNLSEWEDMNVKKERIATGLMSLSGVLSFVPLLLLLGAGGAMVMNGEISIGIFYIFINLSGNVSGFLQNMPGIYWSRWYVLKISVRGVRCVRHYGCDGVILNIGITKIRQGLTNIPQVTILFVI